MPNGIYHTGLIESLANSSDAVVFSASAALGLPTAPDKNIAVGDMLLFYVSGVPYISPVTVHTDATNVTIATNWTGTALEDHEYWLLRGSAWQNIANMSQVLNDFINNFGSSMQFDATNRIIELDRLAAGADALIKFLSSGVQQAMIGFDGNTTLTLKTGPVGSLVDVFDINITTGAVTMGADFNNPVNIKGNDAGIAPHSSANLVVEDTGTNYLQMLTGNADTVGILFGDTDDVDVGKIVYDHATDKLEITIGASLAATVTSAGDFGIGVAPASAFHVSAASAEIRLTDESASGDPLLSFYQTSTLRAKIEYLDSGDILNIDSDGEIVAAPANAECARFTSGGYFKASNDGTYASSTGIYHEFVQTANHHTIIGSSEHVSFSEHMLELRATRAATAAYSFIECKSSGSSDIEFKLSGDGNGTCDGSWTGGGADYAEYFEWSDGNPNNEDRRGISVVLDGDQMRPAVDGETPFGVISGNPSVVGDAAALKWKGKHLKDDFGTYIWENYDALEWTTTETFEQEPAVKAVKAVAETLDKDGNVITPAIEAVAAKPAVMGSRDTNQSYAEDDVPADLTIPANATRTTQQRRKLNPDWSAEHEYVPREDRAEWDTVGLMGKLRLLKGQPVDSRWIKMRDVSATVEEWLVR